MTLLAAAATGSSVTPPQEDPLPYAIPQAAPYNVPRYGETPTPDGSGSVVHPGVWDFGAGQQWHGYRYWMANTPYAGESIALENPCIWGSHNGVDWEVPDGVSNPLYPYPGSAYYSDTDLYYDDATDELVLHWRDSSRGTLRARSGDGITWPASPMIAVDSTSEDDPLPSGTFLASSLVQTPQGDWRLYGTADGILGFYSAATPDGPWTTWTTCTGDRNNWHMHVIYDEAVGLYRAIADKASVHTSADGIFWKAGGSKPLIKGGWEDVNDNYYRCAMRPYSATHYSLWYTIKDAATRNHRVAYTRVPKSFWPAPP